uniref:Reverse transcriptase Ty1/copia-type domain-containing protein n=1 Tax=Triticum urartu TaxID=4572 RepID=A0A8R7U4Q1_TRIUA
MEEEMKAIADNNTWTPAALPTGSRAIGLKWVFKLKKDADGNVVKHKARLVVKGYAQRQGVDFDEVFAPVARMETVRVLIALAAHAGWPVHHMDVKSAFLNGDLAKEVFVHQPEGFINDDNPHGVLRLSKALYGLRQAPRAWYAKLDASLCELGFVRSPLEHVVYRRGSETSFLLVGVYVDDLIITGTDGIDIAAFKAEMQHLFKMSDLGLLSYYLGIEVKQEHGRITPCQRGYAEKVLERAGMAGCNPSQTPMEVRLKLCKEDGSPPADATEYRSIIGCLRYLVNTRPDIALAVGVRSRYMEAPSTRHWTAVKQILRYIRGTLHYGCSYMKGSGAPSLVGFSNSDHGGDVDDRKSTSGVVFFLGGSVVTWTSQKQKVVATSSCEAEYVAAAAATCQGVWLSRLLADLTGRSVEKFQLYIDNKSAIALSKNPVHHDRSKHIDIKYHFIRQCLEENKLDVDHVGTDEQLADILTKALEKIKFVEMRAKIGVAGLRG